MKKFASLNEQMDLIGNSVSEIIPLEVLEKKIQFSIDKQKALIVKFGCDPSRPDLHLGHAVVLKKLREFQELGHSAVLIIGDFTAMIGDPTGRDKTRPQMNKEQILENAETYVDQASKLLDMNSIQIRYNSEWLGNLNFQKVIELASKYTVARMLERDSFEKRYKEGTAISVHEFLYPLAQGYDSVALDCDLELGGTDQKFNLLVGRDLQREYGQHPQAIITMPILEGIDGVEKMSKSYDNYIGLTMQPVDMFGRTMKIPDELIIKYFKFCTPSSPDKIREIETALAKDANPMQFKKQLGREIVTLYHDSKQAEYAQKHFEDVHSKGIYPDDMQELCIDEEKKLIDFIIEMKFAKTKGEVKRAIQQGSVRLNGEKISDIHMILTSGIEGVIKFGKRKFVRLVK